MRPYLAVVKDSFREALRSPVLWIFVGLLTLLLACLAPLGAREVLNTQIAGDDVSNWPELGRRMEAASRGIAPSPGKRIWNRLDSDVRARIVKIEAPKPGATFKEATDFLSAMQDFAKELNKAIESDDLYDKLSWANVKLPEEAQELLDKGLAKLDNSERQRLHRLAVEAAFPDLIRARPKTSFILSYAVWKLPPLPLKKETFHEILGTSVAYMCDIVVGLVLIFVGTLVTARIIPRMFEEGQLHLLLSKPVSRTLLLLFQFVGGCAYVLVMTAYFVLGLWLILGVRFGYWNIKLLWLIPVYVFMFSIYYTVSAASAVVWRTTLMAIINTVLFFIACFALGRATKFFENTILRPQRVARIIPAGDEMLTVNNTGMVSAWNDQKETWEIRFLPKELEGLGNFASLMGANLRMVGPVYSPQRDAIAAVQISFGGDQGRIEQVVAVGKPQNGWANTPGVPVPIGTFAIFEESDGAILVTSGLGIYRLKGDPTVRPKPPKILGFELPTGPPSAFSNAGPADGVVFAPPAVAAYHAPSKQLAVYSQGKLMTFKADEQGKYQLQAERKVEVAASETVALAIGKELVLLGTPDGKIEALSAKNLKERATHEPEKGSAPRFLIASPEGGDFVAVYHKGVLQHYSAADDAWQRPRVKGQGDISGAAFDPAGHLLVAEHTNRITEYELDTGKVLERHDPKLDVLLRGYYYGLRPLYVLLPKPGEFFETMQYLLSGKETAKRITDEPGDAERKLNPWAPVTSGLIFMVVVLGLTCVYFERQEY